MLRIELATLNIIWYDGAYEVVATGNALGESGVNIRFRVTKTTNHTMKLIVSDAKIWAGCSDAERAALAVSVKSQLSDSIRTAMANMVTSIQEEIKPKEVSHDVSPHH